MTTPDAAIDTKISDSNGADKNKSAADDNFLNVPVRKRQHNNQPRRDKRDVHGWVALDKPVGMTSTQAVAMVKRLFSAKRAGHAVVDDRGDKNAEDDRHRLLEARGEDEGEQLGLVADFSEGDDAGGHE